MKTEPVSDKEPMTYLNVFVLDLESHREPLVNEQEDRIQKKGGKVPLCFLSLNYILLVALLQQL